MTMMDRPVVEEQILSVTPAALSKIKELLEQRQIPNHALRVFVTGGGCSGLSYGMAFEENIQEYDTLVEVEGVKLVVDATSILYLKGSVIDFVDSLMGGGFSIDNPQAVSTCGCGHSFRTGESGEASEGGCSTCH
jgi:iron-sulfur cluster assembly protein